MDPVSTDPPEPRAERPAEASLTGAGQPNVVLVSMPWINLVQPALGLATLRGHLDREGLACRVYHANLDLLAHVSVRTYELISDLIGINEFLFTAPLQPELEEAQLRLLIDQCETFAERKCNEDYPTGGDLARMFVALRQTVIPGYLAQCADRILAMQPTLVGFTCMFDQTVASVALARLLKEARPDLTIALGGYAVQHDNGLEVLRAFPWVDCVARGDGEPVIADLAWASVGARDLGAIRGVLGRDQLDAGPPRPAPRWNLSGSAFPNFDDWFADLERLNTEHKVLIRSPYLLLESSRGCWWGQKHHCTFCGIDDDTLKYRSKSSDQIVREIRHLRERHGDHIAIRFADYIMPFNFYRELLPFLQGFDPPIELEAEIKANQKRETVRAFAQAGFVGLQPGIESFSTSVLRKMEKGTTATQNVQLLKWSYENGIEMQYNLLVGFPDDDPDDYAEMVRTLPRLYHLNPPSNFSLVAVTRFAPLHTTPERFGFAGELHHHPFYDVMFSDAFLAETGFDMDRYCYNFDRYFENDQPLRRLYGQLKLQTEFWRSSHQERSVFLSHRLGQNKVMFKDTRFQTAETFAVEGLAAKLYALCADKAVGLDVLEDRFPDRAALSEAIAILDERRVIWTSDERIFGLGVASDIVSANLHSGFKWRWTAIGRKVAA